MDRRRTLGNGSFQAFFTKTKVNARGVVRLRGDSAMVTREIEAPRVNFKLRLRFELPCLAVSDQLGPCIRACRRAEGSSP